MDEKDKRIHLAFFIFLFLNIFYGLVTNSYSYLFYSIFALVISYFVIYQEKFFLILDNARSFGKRFINSPKILGGYRSNLVEGNQGTNVPNQMENNRDKNERCKEKGDSKENIESGGKGISDTLYY